MNAVLNRPKGRCAKFTGETGRDPRFVPFEDGVDVMTAHEVTKRAGVSEVSPGSTINVAGKRANLETPVLPGEAVSLTPHVAMG